MTRDLNMQYLPLRDSKSFIIFIFFSLKSRILDFKHITAFQVCLMQQPSQVHLLIIFLGGYFQDLVK